MPSVARYDAFLSYNSLDRPAVEELAERLEAEGLTLYLEVWELLPGRDFQPGLAGALTQSRTCVAFLGPNGLGSWQVQEIQIAIDRRVRDPEFHVIPVLLPGAERPKRGSVAHLEFLINASWVEFLKTTDDRKLFESLIAGIKGIKPQRSNEDAKRWEGRRPYRGLEAFGLEDADFFFGRDNLTDWLVSGLRREIRASQGVRFLPVLGPSGSGKSSVVLAGLLPRLKGGAIDGSEQWPVVVVRPGEAPLRNLAAELVRKFSAEGEPPDVGRALDLASQLQTDDEALDLFARMALSGKPAESRLLVVIDQFEEVFTYRPQDDEARSKFEGAQAAFFANLLHAATAPGGKVAVVLTMRSDFLGPCASFPRLNALMTAHLEQVGPMRERDLREAIERPAFLVGCELEPGLTERLLADVEGQAGALPLLQFTLDVLWNERRGRKLAKADYDEMGGIQGSLELHANKIYSGLKPEEQEICKRIFLRLVQPGEGVEDTKRRVSLHNLIPHSDPGRAEGVRRVIEKLAHREARLVTTEAASPSTAGAIELAHEALIHGWKQLREWIDKDRAGLHTRDRLSEAAKEWVAAAPEKRDDYLYTGARLAVAREWADAHRDDLVDVEAVFLAASQEAQMSEAERERRLREEAEARAKNEHLLQRRFFATAVVASVFALAASGFAWLAKQYGDSAVIEAHNADDQRKNAVKEAERARAQERLAESRRLAALSETVRQKRLDLALLLAVEARIEDSLEARISLLRSLDTRPELSQILHVVPKGVVSRVAFGPGGAIAAGYSDMGAGQLAQLGNAEACVALFDAKGERRWAAPLEGKGGFVTSVAFGSGGAVAAGYLVFSSGGSGVAVFDAKGERRWAAPLEVKGGYVTSVAFSPGGAVAAGYSLGVEGRGGGGVVLFDAKGVQLRAVPIEVTGGYVTSVVLGPGGTAAARYHGKGGGVAVFDAKGERRWAAPLEVKGDDVMTPWQEQDLVAFGPDGAVATGYHDGVAVFDAKGERRWAAPLEVKGGYVTSVAFGPGGAVAAGYSLNGGLGGAVALFDAKGERLRAAPLEIKGGAVTSVAFGPGGAVAAGYGLEGLGGGVAVFDPKGERLRAAPLEVKGGYVTSVAFSPGGAVAAGYSFEGLGGGVAVFDARGEQLWAAPLKVKEGPVTTVAFGPGDAIAAGYGVTLRKDGGNQMFNFFAGGVALFDSKGEWLWAAPLAVKEGLVTSVAFGHGGAVAAGYSLNGGLGGGGGVVLFDAKGQRLRAVPIEVKGDRVTSVALGPGGTAAARYRGKSSGVAVFDAKGQRLWAAPLEAKESYVWEPFTDSVVFGPGGAVAAGYSFEGLGGGVAVFDPKGERRWAAPLEVTGGYVTSLAFGPGGAVVAGYRLEDLVGGGVVLFDAKGERLWAAPLEVTGGSLTSVAFGPGGAVAAGYGGKLRDGGVVLMDADPASWLRKAGRVANRNLTWQEWRRYFPEAEYRRTFRNLPWPTDLPEEERQRAEETEKKRPRGVNRHDATLPDSEP